MKDLLKKFQERALGLLKRNKKEEGTKSAPPSDSSQTSEQLDENGGPKKIENESDKYDGQSTQSSEEATAEINPASSGDDTIPGSANWTDDPAVQKEMQDLKKERNKKLFIRGLVGLIILYLGYDLAFNSKQDDKETANKEVAEQKPRRGPPPNKNKNKKKKGAETSETNSASAEKPVSDLPAPATVEPPPANQVLPQETPFAQNQVTEQAEKAPTIETPEVAKEEQKVAGEVLPMATVPVVEDPNSDALLNLDSELSDLDKIDDIPSVDPTPEVIITPTESPKAEDLASVSTEVSTEDVLKELDQLEKSAEKGTENEKKEETVSEQDVQSAGEVKDEMEEEMVPSKAPSTTEKSAHPVGMNELLAKLEEESGIKTTKSKKAKYVAPPAYDSTGRGLVYNCHGHHWACLGKIPYVQCSDHFKWSQENKKKPSCAPIEVYLTDDDCKLAQLQNIHSLVVPTKCGVGQ